MWPPRKALFGRFLPGGWAPCRDCPAERWLRDGRSSDERGACAARLRARVGPCLAGAAAAAPALLQLSAVFALPASAVPPRPPQQPPCAAALRHQRRCRLTPPQPLSPSSPNSATPQQSCPLPLLNLPPHWLGRDRALAWMWMAVSAGQGLGSVRLRLPSRSCRAGTGPCMDVPLRIDLLTDLPPGNCGGRPPFSRRLPAPLYACLFRRGHAFRPEGDRHRPLMLLARSTCLRCSDVRSLTLARGIKHRYSAGKKIGPQRQPFFR